MNQAWLCAPLIPALEAEAEVSASLEFEANQGYIVRSYLKKQTTTTTITKTWAALPEDPCSISTTHGSFRPLLPPGLHMQTCSLNTHTH